MEVPRVGWQEGRTVAGTTGRTRRGRRREMTRAVDRSSCHSRLYSSGGAFGDLIIAVVRAMVVQDG
jgi:hypothetical protein